MTCVNVIHDHWQVATPAESVYKTLQLRVALRCELSVAVHHRSGVALAMRHRHQSFIHPRAHGLRKGDETPRLKSSWGRHMRHFTFTSRKQGIAPEESRRYAPADGSSTVAKKRVCPQSAHLWWPAVAKLQATSVPIA